MTFNVRKRTIRHERPANIQISLRIHHLDSHGCKFLHANIEVSNRTAQMRMRIWVVVARTWQKVRLLTLEFLYDLTWSVSVVSYVSKQLLFSPVDLKDCVLKASETPDLTHTKVEQTVVACYRKKDISRILLPQDGDKSLLQNRTIAI